jgi:hypothetical protein
MAYLELPGTRLFYERQGEGNPLFWSSYTVYNVMLGRYTH